MTHRNVQRSTLNAQRSTPETQRLDVESWTLDVERCAPAPNPRVPGAKAQRAPASVKPLKPQASSLKPLLRAFTLTELLIVIAIMILLLSVAVPAVSKLLNAGREDSAQGALGAAIAMARSYSGRNPPMDIPYQGTALIVTPANELRIVEHIENAFDPNNPDWGTVTNRKIANSGAAPGANPRWPKSGYVDIKGEGYIQMPKGVGLVGITRNDATTITLVTPPFALRFDPNGHVIVRGPDTGSVVYDGNYDYQYETDFRYTPYPARKDRYRWAWRPVDYDPAKWDPEIVGKTVGTYDPHAANAYKNPPAIFNGNHQKYMLAFEELETVIGMIAFNRQSLYDQLGTDALKGQDDDAAKAAATANNTNYGGEIANLRKPVRDWLLQNGKVIFFNRYSGAIIKP